MFLLGDYDILGKALGKVQGHVTNFKMWSKEDT